MLFGVKKFHQYLAGNHFTTETDHKPLFGLFAETKVIPMMASARIQRWALTLSAYEYELVYRPGSQIVNADCLSRLPAKEKPSIQETPVPPEYIMLLELMDTTPVTSKHIRSWTRQDPVLSTVLRYVECGWPNFCENPEMKAYYCRRDELTVQHDCVLWGNRVVIPPPGRDRIIRELHEAHTGISRMKALARSYVWWPSMDSILESTVKKCEVCQQMQQIPAKA
ncbi:uncharacterized protein K02A2.6-like [Haliotis rufescens]|uniref:uncharacterized protein K02A2.6-like n=1 Tax=Haliotis rufescens TaxID=6454 RepID=UPI00201F02DF|nr:uncharacterized protein K02A2.6-like [Haliotis rufescens]